MLCGANSSRKACPPAGADMVVRSSIPHKALDVDEVLVTGRVVLDLPVAWELNWSIRSARKSSTSRQSPRRNSMPGRSMLPLSQAYVGTVRLLITEDLARLR